jgi:SAM-dependent methyltransferase
VLPPPDLSFESGIERAEQMMDRDAGSSYIAPFLPSPQEVIDRMLEMAEVNPRDLVYDLGSGDGRVAITAAGRYGAKAVGFEIDPPLVTHSRRKIRAAGLEDRVEIREQDIRTVDLSPASVVTLYLCPEANLALKAACLSQLKPGSRVVSHYFGMVDWKPRRVEQMTDSAGFLRSIYLWRMEDQRDGRVLLS